MCVWCNLSSPVNTQCTDWSALTPHSSLCSRPRRLPDESSICCTKPGGLSLKLKETVKATISGQLFYFSTCMHVLTPHVNTWTNTRACTHARMHAHTHTHTHTHTHLVSPRSWALKPTGQCFPRLPLLHIPWRSSTEKSSRRKEQWSQVTLSSLWPLSQQLVTWTTLATHPPNLNIRRKDRTPHILCMYVSVYIHWVHKQYYPLHICECVQLQGRGHFKPSLHTGVDGSLQISGVTTGTFLQQLPDV